MTRPDLKQELDAYLTEPPKGPQAASSLMNIPFIEAQLFLPPLEGTSSYQLSVILSMQQGPELGPPLL